MEIKEKNGKGRGELMSRQIYKEEPESRQIRVDSEVHRSVKMKATEWKITIKKFVEDCLVDYLELVETLGPKKEKKRTCKS